MRTHQFSSAIILAGILLTGCAGAIAEKPDTKAMAKPAAEAPAINPEVTAAIAAAKAAQKKAAAADGEWRDVGKFIKNAEKAAKAGKDEQAMKLAKKAQRQSELGYEQAMEQKKTASMEQYFPK